MQLSPAGKARQEAAAWLGCAGGNADVGGKWKGKALFDGERLWRGAGCVPWQQECSLGLGGSGPRGAPFSEHPKPAMRTHLPPRRVHCSPSAQPQPLCTPAQLVLLLTAHRPIAGCEGRGFVTHHPCLHFVPLLPWMLSVGHTSHLTSSVTFLLSLF